LKSVLAGAIAPFLVQYLAASFGDVPERGNGREAAIRPNRGRLFDGEGLNCFLVLVGNVDPIPTDFSGQFCLIDQLQIKLPQELRRRDRLKETCMVWLYKPSANRQSPEASWNQNFLTPASQQAAI
jgi:hypothetical protein